VDIFMKTNAVELKIISAIENDEKPKIIELTQLN
jgi:hypothetical protein